MKRYIPGWTICAAFAVAAASTAAPAATINLIDVGGITGTEAELGFRVAASYWSNILAGDTVINVQVGMQGMDRGTLGWTQSRIENWVPMTAFYDALNANATSALDAVVLAGLPTLSGTGGISVTVPDYVSGTGGAVVGRTRIADGADSINSTLTVNAANAKELGLKPESRLHSPDGRIMLNSDTWWDYDPTDGIGGSSLDFIGTAVHELGHVLGFQSGVDDFDLFAAWPSGYQPDGDSWGMPLDLFRYSEAGKTDWSIGTASYMSFDGGVTNEGLFSTGEHGGDGWQASHWKASDGCAATLGLFNPFSCPGIASTVSARDLMAIDAIGWNLNRDILADRTYLFSTADMYRDFAAAVVPEPSTWAMMIAGFSAIGVAMRRRRRMGWPLHS